MERATLPGGCIRRNRWSSAKSGCRRSAKRRWPMSDSRPSSWPIRRRRWPLAPECGSRNSLLRSSSIRRFSVPRRKSAVPKCGFRKRSASWSAARRSCAASAIPPPEGSIRKEQTAITCHPCPFPATRASTPMRMRTAMNGTSAKPTAGDPFIPQFRIPDSGFRTPPMRMQFQDPLDSTRMCC